MKRGVAWHSTLAATLAGPACAWLRLASTVRASTVSPCESVTGVIKRPGTLSHHALPTLAEGRGMHRHPCRRQVSASDMHEQGPSDRQGFASTRWSLTYASRGGLEGAHVPFRGASSESSTHRPLAHLPHRAALFLTHERLQRMALPHWQRLGSGRWRQRPRQAGAVPCRCRVSTLESLVACVPVSMAGDLSGLVAFNTAGWQCLAWRWEGRES